MNGVPVLYNSNRNSKDAGLDFKITYIWDGNNPQQTGNIVHIYDNATNEIVYRNARFRPIPLSTGLFIRLPSM